MKYAIIESVSVFVPGDERSRTHPGHGYPDSYEKHTDFHEFANEDEVIKWISTRGDSKQYRVIMFEDVVVETSLKIKPIIRGFS